MLYHHSNFMNKKLKAIGIIAGGETQRISGISFKTYTVKYGTNLTF